MRTKPSLKFTGYNGPSSRNRGHSITLDFTNSKDGRATVEVKPVAEVKPTTPKKP